MRVAAEDETREVEAAAATVWDIVAAAALAVGAAAALAVALAAVALALAAGIGTGMAAAVGIAAGGGAPTGERAEDGRTLAWSLVRVLAPAHAGAGTATARDRSPHRPWQKGGNENPYA